MNGNRVSEAPNVEFRVVGPDDDAILAEMFSDVDETFFRPHPFTAAEARRIAHVAGRDAYVVLVERDRAVAYGMLRGWDEGYPVPSLGIAVRTDSQGRGLGRLMMIHLHAEARRRGATIVRLRVHPGNLRARRLYESLGYAYAGEDRDELVMLLDLESPSSVEIESGHVQRSLTSALLGVDAVQWTTFLRSTRHDFYHLPAYVALCAAREKGEPVALYVTDGVRSMLLPLIVRRIPGGGYDAVSPYGYPGPLVSGEPDEAFLRLAMASGTSALRAERIVSAFIRLHPILNPSAPEGVGTIVHHGDTVSVDLSLASEILWGETRYDHRRDIARALTLGYVAHMDEGFVHYETFKQLYHQTMERRSAAPFYIFDDLYWNGLRAALGEQLHLCVVEKDGAVAAGGLFVETDGLVQYHLSGSVEGTSRVQPTKLMLDFVRRWAKERGDLHFHLGGGVGGADDSLMQFKLGFSPVRHPFRTLRIVLDEEEYRRLVLALDPSLDPGSRRDYFPRYRRGDRV